MLAGRGRGRLRRSPREAARAADAAANQKQTQEARAHPAEEAEAGCQKRSMTFEIPFWHLLRIG